MRLQILECFRLVPQYIHSTTHYHRLCSSHQNQSNLFQHIYRRLISPSYSFHITHCSLSGTVCNSIHVHISWKINRIISDSLMSYKYFDHTQQFYWPRRLDSFLLTPFVRLASLVFLVSLRCFARRTRLRVRLSLACFRASRASSESITSEGLPVGSSAESLI